MLPQMGGESLEGSDCGCDPSSNLYIQKDTRNTCWGEIIITHMATGFTEWNEVGVCG